MIFALRDSGLLLGAAVMTLAAPLTVKPDEPIGPPGQVDAAAHGAVQAMMDALGGREAWDRTPSLRFTFTYLTRDTVRALRTHWWDRRTNQYRVQGTGRDGKAFVVVLNLDTREGEAWIDGSPASGDDKAGLLKRGYGLYINDTYWLLMPFKLFDPGVHLAVDGEARLGDAACDRIRVTFDDVGLTPGDTYWLYVDRETHRLLRWGFILERERDKPEARETLFDWTDWKSQGGVMVATTRRKVGDPEMTEIRIRDLAVGDPLPGEIFTETKPVRF